MVLKQQNKCTTTIPNNMGESNKSVKNRRQTQKNTYCLIPFLYKSKTGELGVPWWNQMAKTPWSQCRDAGLTTGQGPRSFMLQLKIPHAAAKIQCSQMNNKRNISIFQMGELIPGITFAEPVTSRRPESGF